MVKPQEPVIVRANRFEVVDDQGQIRVVAGELNAADGEARPYGLELYDKTGSAKAWLIDNEGLGTTQLCLAIKGNQVLVIDAGDVDGEAEAGASIMLCNLDGAPIISCSVDQNGEPALQLGRNA